MLKKLQNSAAKVAKGNPKKYDHATPIIQLRKSEEKKQILCETRA